MVGSHELIRETGENKGGLMKLNIKAFALVSGLVYGLVLFVSALWLMARGYSNQDIAEKLVIDSRTVGKHVSNILAKLHLANRTQATLYALREGLASLEQGP